MTRLLCGPVLRKEKNSVNSVSYWDKWQIHDCLPLYSQEHT